MNYYLVNVYWTSESDSSIVSGFIVESPNIKEAITQVLLKYGFPSSNGRLQVRAVELEIAMEGRSIYELESAVQNGR